MDAPLHNPGPANRSIELPEGVRVWDPDRFGGRLHVRTDDGAEVVAPTRADLAHLG